MGVGSVALVVARSRDLFPLAKGPCANRGIVEPERVAGTPPLFQIYEVIFSVAHGVGWAIARFEMRLRVTSRRDCTAWRRDAFFWYTLDCSSEQGFGGAFVVLHLEVEFWRLSAELLRSLYRSAQLGANPAASVCTRVCSAETRALSSAGYCGHAERIVEK